MGKPKEKLCDRCGEPIPSSYKDSDGYCSDECREADEREFEDLLGY